MLFRSVTSTTDAGITDASDADFTVTIPPNNPIPSISSISPASITATSGDTVLTVNGSSFVAQSVIEFAGIDLATTRGFTPFVPFTVKNGVITTYPFMEYPMGLEDRKMDATNVTQIVDS